MMRGATKQNQTGWMIDSRVFCTVWQAHSALKAGVLESWRFVCAQTGQPSAYIPQLPSFIDETLACDTSDRIGRKVIERLTQGRVFDHLYSDQVNRRVWSSNDVTGDPVRLSSWTADVLAGAVRRRIGLPRHKLDFLAGLGGLQYAEGARQLTISRIGVLAYSGSVIAALRLLESRLRINPVMVSRPDDYSKLKDSPWPLHMNVVTADLSLVGAMADLGHQGRILLPGIETNAFSGLKIVGGLSFKQVVGEIAGIPDPTVPPPRTAEIISLDTRRRLLAASA